MKCCLPAGMYPVIRTSLLLMGFLRTTLGQTCTWNFSHPAGDTVKRAAGSSVVFRAQAIGEVMTTADRLTWKASATDVVVLRFSGSTFSRLFGVSSATTQNTGTGRHSLTISNLTVAEFNNTEISVISGGCSVNDVSPGKLLLVNYCNLAHFEEAYATDNQSDCGYMCTRTFQCRNLTTSTFQATCQDDATWGNVSQSDSDRCKSCDPLLLNSTSMESDTSFQAAVGQTKKFECLCNRGSKSFVAECMSGLRWNYTGSTAPCDPVCDPSEVHVGQPVNNGSYLCGKQQFTCKNQTVCALPPFELECRSDGTWDSFDNYCVEATCSQASIAAVCRSEDNCQYGGVSGITCGSSLEYNCTSGSSRTKQSAIVCNATDSFNDTAPLCYVPCQETCDNASIQAICQENCNMLGDISKVDCNGTLSYNCTNENDNQTAVHTVQCIARNTFSNASGRLCEAKESDDKKSCSDICDTSSIDALCGESCWVHNISNLCKGDSLQYKCVGEFERVTSLPIQCLGNNTFNSTSVCKSKSTRSGSGPVCSLASIKSVCNGSCIPGNVEGVSGEPIIYKCDGCDCSTTAAVFCIGADTLNASGPLCNCRGGACCDSCCSQQKTSQNLMIADIVLALVVIALVVVWIRKHGQMLQKFVIGAKKKSLSGDAFGRKMWAPIYITICPALGVSLATIAPIVYATSSSCCVPSGACCDTGLCTTARGVPGTVLSTIATILLAVSILAVGWDALAPFTTPSEEAFRSGNSGCWCAPILKCSIGIWGCCIKSSKDDANDGGKHESDVGEAGGERRSEPEDIPLVEQPEKAAVA